MSRRQLRQAEVTAQQRMIDRIRERFGLWPQRLAADAADGSAENLAWLLACDRHRFKRIPQDPRREGHLVEPLADPPHAGGYCRRRHHRSAVWRGTWSPAAPRINGRRLERNRKFVDSPLEGDGFELLEQDSKRLNQKEDSQIRSFVIQDAGWGWGPASDGK